MKDTVTTWYALGRSAQRQVIFGKGLLGFNIGVAVSWTTLVALGIIGPFFLFWAGVHLVLGWLGKFHRRKAQELFEDILRRAEYYHE